MSETFYNPNHLDEIFSIASSESGCIIPHHWLEMFVSIRNAVRESISSTDAELTFEVTPWKKQVHTEGGGVMSIGRGKAIEKSAVQLSVVQGAQYPSLEKNYEGKPFQAAGVSVICHPFNPNAPIAHMNIRYICVGEPESSSRTVWIGGGADLTPMIPFEQDTAEFHDAFKSVCNSHKQGDYEKYKKWCDEYFYIPHLKETRGVGGIFYEYLSVNESSIASENSLQFQKSVGVAFANVYQKILNRRVNMPFDSLLKQKQLVWRSRYAEFNLVYDRGTRFGLMSGGNPKAILASLPPVVCWP
jgi:coproporphyrinogen III oxidase